MFKEIFMKLLKFQAVTVERGLGEEARIARCQNFFEATLFVPFLFVCLFLFLFACLFVVFVSRPPIIVVAGAETTRDFKQNFQRSNRS